MTAIPHSTVAAVLDKQAGALVVREIPVASIYEDEILIAAKACSVKAVDNYHIDYNWAPDGSLWNMCQWIRRQSRRKCYQGQDG